MRHEAPVTLPTMRFEYQHKELCLLLTDERGYDTVITRIKSVKQPFGVELYQVNSDNRFGLYTSREAAAQAVIHRVLLDYAEGVRKGIYNTSGGAS